MGATCIGGVKTDEVDPALRDADLFEPNAPMSASKPIIPSTASIVFLFDDFRAASCAVL
ncbi:MAG: hypothetical protein QOK24_2795 [Verrucomicrobiota bacterium]